MGDALQQHVIRNFHRPPAGRQRNPRLHQQGVVCLSKQRALFLAPMHKHIILRRLHLPTTEWQRTAG